MRHSSIIMILAVLFFLTSLPGCSYQDIRRPPARNYLRSSSELPPDPETRSAAARFQRMRAEHIGYEKMLPENYIPGPGDVVFIRGVVPGLLDPELRVMDPELELETRVKQDHTILCPLLGPVSIEGLTVTEIEEKLSRDYSRGYLNQPHVEVSVLEYNSKLALVTGHVAAPGEYPVMGERISLLNLLIRSGGLTQGAGETATITRSPRPGAPGTSPRRQETANLDKLMRQGHADHNAWIYPGDSVHVHPEEPAEHVYVIGFSRRNQAVELPRHRDLGILEAITLAGGITEVARGQYTSLVRRYGEETEVYDIDLTRIADGRVQDIPLQPRDKIIISTDWLRRAYEGFRQLLPFRVLAPPQ